MLHLTLVANILNAVGGTPDFEADDFVAPYPTHLPDDEAVFEVGVGPFSREAVSTFPRIERPRTNIANGSLVTRRRHGHGVAPHVDDGSIEERHSYSTGEFYQEVDHGLSRIHAQLVAQGEELFTGDPGVQVTSSFRYGGGGRIVEVTDLDSAHAAIRLICEQGEGLGGSIHDEDGELSHFFRFQQILLQR